MRANTWNSNGSSTLEIGKENPYAKGSFVMFLSIGCYMCGSTSNGIGHKGPLGWHTQFKEQMVATRIPLGNFGYRIEPHHNVLFGAKSIFHKRLLKHQRTYRRNKNLLQQSTINRDNITLVNKNDPQTQTSSSLTFQPQSDIINRDSS